MTLNSITFVNFIYHAKQAFKSISNPNLQSIHKVNTTLHKVLQSEIPSIREDVSKLKTDVDASTEYFPAKAVVKRMDKLESRMSYIESKLDSIITLLGNDVKKGEKEKVQSTPYKIPESVRKDDENTDNDGNKKAPSKEGSDAATRLKSKFTSKKSTQASQSQPRKDKGKSQMIDEQPSQTQEKIIDNPDEASKFFVKLITNSGKVVNRYIKSEDVVEVFDI